MKQKFLFKFILGAGALALILPITPKIIDNLNAVVGPINEAQAEQLCPARKPTSRMMIHTGSSDGPVIGDYTNYGWNNSEDADPTYAELSVPNGTVLYYSSWGDGFTGPNRSLGTTHYINTAATVTGGRVGYYPTGYNFTRTSYVEGFTDPLTKDTYISIGGYFSCWGGFDDGIGLISVRIKVGGAPPAPRTKTSTATLAVVKDPKVTMLGRPANSSEDFKPQVNIPVRRYVDLKWSTESVNFGNSCEASGDYPSWTGAKIGQVPFNQPDPAPPSGGAARMGMFRTAGVYDLTIHCYGLNNVKSAPSTVRVVVGEVPAFSCEVLPNIQDLPKGSDGVFSTLRVIPHYGYDKTVTFAAQILPAGQSAPSLSFNGGRTTITSPYIDRLSGIIRTSATTAPGLYEISFFGIDGTLDSEGGQRQTACPSIFVNVTPPQPEADIDCGDPAGDGPCTVPRNQPAQITWSSSNVTSCIVSQASPTGTPPVQFANGKNGIQSSGPLTDNTMFYLNCDGPDGKASDSVEVKVSGELPANEPDLSSSDKDVIAVTGRISKAFNPNVCSGSTSPNVVDLPGNAIFSVGDVITFQLNICNRGSAAAKNVTINDKLFNSNNPEIARSLVNPEIISTNQPGCATEDGKTVNTISFKITSLEPNQICSIKFKATLQKPLNPSSGIYRFQNTGEIIVPAFPNRNAIYYTPPYLFSLTGVPDREETSSVQSN